MSDPLNEAGERWDDDYGLDPRAKPTTPQLTEADVAKMERRLTSITGQQLDSGHHPISWEQANALIRDWRAMRAENGDLRKSVEDWVTHYNEVEAWRSQLSASNAALREQLENVYESLAISVARLQSQLAQVTSERDEARRLLREVSNVHLAGE